MVPVTMFISYAHEDEQLLKALKTHLEGLRRQGLIDTWFDRKIGAGKEWAWEIDNHFLSADIILLLISPDFMASDYINDVELKRAMVWHNQGLGRVIPIILRPTDWEYASFGKLLALPTDGKPVTTWSNQDEALLMVAKGIREVVEEFSPTVDPFKRMSQKLYRKQADNKITDYNSEVAMKHIEKMPQPWKQSLPPAQRKSMEELNKKILGQIFPDLYEKNEQS